MKKLYICLALFCSLPLFGMATSRECRCCLSTKASIDCIEQSFASDKRQLFYHMQQQYVNAKKCRCSSALKRKNVSRICDCLNNLWLVVPSLIKEMKADENLFYDASLQAGC